MKICEECGTSLKALFFVRCKTNMATAENLYFEFSLMATSNELLELGT